MPAVQGLLEHLRGPTQCQQEITMSVPEGSDTQHPLNLSERFAKLSWSPTLAGPWVQIAIIKKGKSNLVDSSFAGHISVSNRWFIVTNASKAIAGNLKIVNEMNESKCLASIHLNVTEPAPTSAPVSQVALVSNWMAAGEPGSQSTHIVAVVVGTVVAFLVLVLALGLWQRNKKAHCRDWFRSCLGFRARAAPSQQAGDASPVQEMQELAKMTQPEDASGGDRSAVMSGKLLGSAEMRNTAGLESGEG
nr:uncharacterized protein LOC103306806 isoform X2 [Chrysemys picta bellii]